MPPSGKKVAAEDWWTPRPAKGSASRLTSKGVTNLSVYSEPDVEVVTACTTTSCPWPKQLFLRDQLDIDLTQSASWDLFRFPFDTQTVRAQVTLLDPEDFVLPDAFTSSILNSTLPNPSSFNYDAIYRPGEPHSS